MALHERGERVDRAKVLARAFVVGGNGQRITLAQHDADFERVDGIEANAVGIEQRRIVAALLGTKVLEIEGIDQQLLNF